MSPLFAAEAGYQVFELGSKEWALIIFSGLTAVLAVFVGMYLMRGVLAADAGTPKMKEIAAAIQEGALAYLKRQFRTIAFILIPGILLGLAVFAYRKGWFKRRGSGAAPR